MTQEQKTAEQALKSARLYLTYARRAYKIIPGDMDAARRLAKAVRDEQSAQETYVVAMTAGLAAEISEIVPNAFQD